MSRFNFIVLISFLCCCLPGFTQALPCTFGSDPPDRGVDWDNIDPVPPEDLMNSDFSFHFTMKTEWDWENPPQSALGQWGIVELREFAELIMPETDPSTGYACQVLDYFAENAYDENDDPYELGIYTTVTNPDDPSPPPAGILDHFELRIYDSAGAAHAYNYALEVIIKNDPQNPIPGSGCTGEYMSPECVARTWFAHEWQHVCHIYYTDREHAWTEPLSISGGNYNEMTSIFSEFLFGYGANAPISDLHYDLGLPNTSDSFYQSCMCTWDDDPEVLDEVCLSRHHYSELGLFALYLQNNLSQGSIDFYPDWIRNFEEVPPDSIYRRDFLRLSEWIDDHSSEYAGLLQGGYGSTEVAPAIELFHKFNAAKFINLGSPNLDEQLYQWSSTMTPQDFYGLFQDWDDYWYDNVHTYPPYHVVGVDEVTYGPVVETEDFWPNEWNAEMSDWWEHHNWYPTLREYTRVVHLSSNAANYLVFLPEEENHGTLQISFFIEDVMPCIVGDENGVNGGSIEYHPFEGVDDMSLNIQVWGYQDLPGPVSPDGVGLDQYGDYAELIESRLYTGGAPLDRFEFRVDDFGPEYDAVAVILSLTELDAFPPETPYESNAIPYRYSAHILPEQIVTLNQVVNGHQILPAESIVWVPWPVWIAYGAILEIEEGCQIYFTDEDAELNISGSLIINGTENLPVVFDVGAYSGLPPSRWEGISYNPIATSDLQIYHADFTNLVEFTGDGVLGKSVEIIHSNFVFGFSPSTSSFVFPGDPVQGPLILDHVSFYNSDEVVVSEATLTDCVIRQRPTVYPPELPALTVADGSNYMSNIGCFFRGVGIAVGDANTTTNLEIGPNIEIKQHELERPSHSTGFVVKNNAFAQTSLGLSDLTLDIKNSNTGIEVQAGGSLILRWAKVEVENYGVTTWPDNMLTGDVAFIDLGTLAEHGSNTIRPLGDDGCEGEGTPGNCLAVVASEPPIEVRVWNRSLSSPINAIGNTWARCVCEDGQYPNCPCADEYFLGDVEWFPFHPIGSCCGLSGGFFMGTGSAEIPFSVYPNPSNAMISVVFPYQVGESVPQLVVYGLSGRRIIDLGAGNVSEKSISWVWDGTDSANRMQSSGIYFIQVKQDDQVFNKKVVVLK